MKRPIGAALLAIYIGSVVLANWLTSRYGLLRVAPGVPLMVTAGTFAVGGAIMVRDFLQDALGRLAVIGAVLAGAGISYGISDHKIALASGVTFLLAETLEFLVYTPLRRRYGWGTRKWGGVVLGANAVGAVGDTFLFLALAGFPVTAAVAGGQLIGKAYVTLAVILAATLLRPAVTRRVRA